MFQTLFGDVQNGRLKRLPFVGWYLVVLLLALVAAFLIGIAIAATAQVAGGGMADMETAKAMLVERFGPVGIVVTVAVFAVLWLADLNLMAKRFRDMGLPGWWTLLGVLLASGLLAQLGQGLATTFSLLVLIVLVSVPTGALARMG